MTKRVWRSTRVAIAVLPFLPMIRSPSQWPGTARSSTSAGRSRDHDHVRDAARRRCDLAGPSLRATGAQTAGQFAAQLAAALHVQRLVDRLVRHPHLRIVGKLDAQPPGDLLRATTTARDPRPPAAQRRVRRQLRHLRPPSPRHRPAVRSDRPIAAPAAVRGDLPDTVDAARPKPPADRRERQPGCKPDPDLDPFLERQPDRSTAPTLRADTPPRADHQADRTWRHVQLGRGSRHASNPAPPTG